MEKFRDGLFGLAVGDAMGVALINVPRQALLKSPVTEMLEGGLYDVPKGTWSTPTEVTLATRNSLEGHNLINTESIMNGLENVLQGKYSLMPGIFSLGKTTEKAVEIYKRGISPEKCGGINLNENGSGALQMMYPIADYAYDKKLQESEVLELVKTVVSLTHAHEINIIGCYLYTLYILFLLRGKDKYASLSMLQCCDFSMFKEEYLNLYDRILKTSLKDISIDNIKTDGYIVSSLESSLYVLLNSENYAQSIIGAINLGGKTTTIASMVGCMAGILYGEESIPINWYRTLRGKDKLEHYV